MFPERLPPLTPPGIFEDEVSPTIAHTMPPAWEATNNPPGALSDPKIILEPENVDSDPTAKDEIFLSALKACFAGLAQQNETQLEKLRVAVEGLKITPPVMDRRTAFWNTYKTISDEYDREYLQKYGTDLDTSLIFAGLFSAVTSAFIIQIQPAIQSHGTPSLVIISQCLLYVSLSLTLLAALLAVLGKQWLMYYFRCGGARVPSKHAVSSMFPILLQFALLLFSAALSIYLWKIHHALALIAVSFTSLGFSAYVALLLSNVISQDSPFRTPLAPLVAALIPKTFWARSKKMLKHIATRALSLPWVDTLSSANLFQFRRSTPEELIPAPFKPSPEVPAISWILETSTDPHIVTLAAEVAIQLQWPTNLKLVQQTIRLRDAFTSCFLFDTLEDGQILLWDIRNGMATRAIHLGRAYLSLSCVCPSVNWDPKPRFDWSPEALPPTPELKNVLRIIAGRPNLISGSPEALTWALHVIPSLHSGKCDARFLRYFLKQFHETPKLDNSSFTDYLFCLYTFLSSGPTDYVVACIDKSAFQTAILKRCLTAIVENLTAHVISMEDAADIIYTTNRLQRTVGAWVGLPSDRDASIYEFCAQIPQLNGLWVRVVLAAGLLMSDALPVTPVSHSEPPAWVYKALETIPAGQHDHWDYNTTVGIVLLLRVLSYHDAPPREESIPLLLRALAVPEIAKHAVRLLLRDDTPRWFLKETECPIPLENVSVGCHNSSRRRGERSRPRLILSPYELPAWIILFSRRKSMMRWMTEAYNTVLVTIWNASTGDYTLTSMDSVETALALTCAALSDGWQQFDWFSAGSLAQLVPLLRCTTTTLRDTYILSTIVITDNFKLSVYTPLQMSLVQETTAVRQILESSSSGGSSRRAQVLESAVNIMESLANALPQPGSSDATEWAVLREWFGSEIDALEVMIGGATSFI
ncbi:hypothetical protein B0H14DRAFT_3879583 [Mycena olivaceomarginata]|nr:hypothetical protein B0H14DRAFT_3879583 [Mycena olivaceomarginata]